jgi:hypothetical protein
MSNLSFSIKITGAKDSAGQIEHFNNKVLQDIRTKAQIRAHETVNNIRSAMLTEYTSAWATGQTARGVSFRTFVQSDGVEVRFYIAETQALQYITAMMGGHFQQYPVGPFLIFPHRKKSLKIQLPVGAFLRGERGHFKGSVGANSALPSVFKRSVLWGKRTGGFGRDLISELSELEGNAFVADMEAVVQNAIVQLHT